MIEFVEPELEPSERRIIDRSLVFAVETLEKTEAVEACIEIGFGLPLFKGFSKECFLGLLNDLLEAHRSKDIVYYLTDYHFMVLYQIMQWAVLQHNTAVMTDQEPILMDSRYTVNFEDLVDCLFHDKDFLLTSEEYNSLTHEEREALGFSEELFSICNGLPPHPDEMKMVDRPYKKKKRQRIV